jgi:hypothetical protein
VKLGLAVRDLRVLALLLVLATTASLVVMTSWPERDEPRRVEDAQGGAPPAQSTPAPTRLPSSGRRVASLWAEAYFTSAWDDSAAARRARLGPYSSDALIAEMQLDSGALGLHESKAKARPASEAEVVALQQQDGTPGHALIAIVERATTEGGKKSTELVTVTLELIQHDGAWVVDEVLVP